MSSTIIKRTIKTVLCLSPVVDYALAKGLVGKLPGNPASCHEEPCNTDPQHVLAALKVMSVFLAAVFLLPLLLYYTSKLWTKVKEMCSATNQLKAAGGMENPLEANKKKKSSESSGATIKPDKIHKECQLTRVDRHKSSDASNKLAQSAKSSSINGSSIGGNQDAIASKRWSQNDDPIRSRSINDDHSNELLARQYEAPSANLLDCDAQILSLAQRDDWVREQRGYQVHKRAGRSSTALVSMCDMRNTDASQQHRYSMHPGYGCGSARGATQAIASARSIDKRRASHVAKQHRVQPTESSEFKNVFTIWTDPDSKGINGNNLQVPMLSGQHRHSIDSSILNAMLMAQQRQQQQQQQQQQSVSPRCHRASGHQLQIDERCLAAECQHQLALLCDTRDQKSQRRHRNRSHSSHHQLLAGESHNNKHALQCQQLLPS